MIGTPEIVEAARQEAAVIHLTIKRSEMPSVFGPAVGELLTAIAAQGIEPVGAIFAHHLEMTRTVSTSSWGSRFPRRCGLPDA